MPAAHAKRSTTPGPLPRLRSGCSAKQKSAVNARPHYGRGGVFVEKMPVRRIRDREVQGGLFSGAQHEGLAAMARKLRVPALPGTRDVQAVAPPQGSSTPGVPTFLIERR